MRFRPLVATLVVLVALAAVVLLTRRRAPAPVPERAPAEATPTPVPGKLVLFFPGDDALLHREAREVPEIPAAIPARIRLVMEELAAGSREGFAPALPWSATVQAVFVDKSGNAYVDLSPPPPDTIGGADVELAVAYGTVNSVVANCPGIERVQLLLGGRQVETLGHLALGRPLPPNLDLVAP